MDTKRTIGTHSSYCSELDQEQIVNLLEVPKILIWGSLLSTFSLARILQASK